MSELFCVKNYVVEVLQDMNPESPRSAFNNLGKMVCAHDRYWLGDEQLSIDKYDSWESAKNDIVKDGISLDLYLYDHSGITISTTPFNSRWDSGQVGFIYVSKEDVKKTYDVNEITAEIHEKVIKSLKHEVEVYDQYLIGDIYGFKLWKIEEDYMQYLEYTKTNVEELEMSELEEYAEEVNSCWGFYGSDIVKNEMIYQFYVGKDIIEEFKNKYGKTNRAV